MWIFEVQHLQKWNYLLSLVAIPFDNEPDTPPLPETDLRPLTPALPPPSKLPPIVVSEDIEFCQNVYNQLKVNKLMILICKYT